MNKMNMNKLNKWKWNYIVYIVLFCSVLAIGSGYYLGTSFASPTINIKTEEYKKDYSSIDIHRLLVEDTLNQVINLLNKTEKDKTEDICNIFATDYFSSYKYINKEYDMLNIISPYIASCIFGYEFTYRNNNPKLMLLDNTQYEIFKNYFNVELKSFDDTYYLGGTIPNNSYKNTITYKLGDITNYDNLYTVLVIGVDSLTNDDYTGIITISYKNNHIYFESFKMNVK